MYHPERKDSLELQSVSIVVISFIYKVDSTMSLITEVFSIFRENWNHLMI